MGLSSSQPDKGQPKAQEARKGGNQGELGTFWKGRASLRNGSAKVPPLGSRRKDKSSSGGPAGLEVGTGSALAWGTRDLRGGRVPLGRPIESISPGSLF